MTSSKANRTANPDLPNWRGVFPAVTTQFHQDNSVDIAGTNAVIGGLIRDGVHGLVLMGTVGENNSLSAQEKRAILAAAVKAVDKRVPIITGVSELTTSTAAQFAKDAEELGVDGLMVLPAMVYSPTEAELETHFKTVAKATSLPIMLYNNPASYKISIPIDMVVRLSNIANIVCIKEAAEDTRRITDLINALGDSMIVFAGLDDMAFEALALGAKGWVSGLTNAFPKESVAIYELMQQGDYASALEIYRWFMPLLHLDSQPDLVQSIKLAEQIMGRGSERVRMPRMILRGARRKEVVAIVEDARNALPSLSAKSA